jgi:hypothetical protein
VKNPSHKEYAAFCNTGLERSKALEEDIQWFQAKYSLVAPELQKDGPGARYSQKIADLAANDPQVNWNWESNEDWIGRTPFLPPLFVQAFICHYYNFYFAHTAGGRMIGSKVAQMLLDDHNLKFYQVQSLEQDWNAFSACLQNIFSAALLAVGWWCFSAAWWCEAQYQRDGREMDPRAATALPGWNSR